MTDKLRQAIEQAVAILGPEAPLCSGCVDEWTEALRILNDALAQQPAEQEPAIRCTYPLCKTTAGCSGVCSKAVPYTAPQPARRGALTDEEVLKIWSPEPSRPVMGKNKVLTFARAIERAHGIGETK